MPQKCTKYRQTKSDPQIVQLDGYHRMSSHRRSCQYHQPCKKINYPCIGICGHNRAKFSANQRINAGTGRPCHCNEISRKASAGHIRCCNDHTAHKGQHNIQPAFPGQLFFQKQAAAQGNKEDLRVHQRYTSRNAGSIQCLKIAGKMYAQKQTAGHTQKQMLLFHTFVLTPAAGQHHRSQKKYRKQHPVKYKHCRGCVRKAHQHRRQGSSHYPQNNNELFHDFFSIFRT